MQLEAKLANALDDYDAFNDKDEQLIIEAFMSRYKVDYCEAEDIFNETKKWLWLAAKSSEQSEFNLFIDKHLMIIDEMWHNFILHTKQYYKYCFGNFNRIIHHVPTPSKSKQLVNKDRLTNHEAELSKNREKTRKQFDFIYDNLGPDTLLKWYEEMAEKYTPEYLESLRR